MITTTFDNDKKILFAEFKGIITLSDFIADIKNIGSDNSLPRDLKILTDASEASFEFDPKDIPTAIVEIKKYVSSFNSIKEAFIQNSPKTTALSMVLQLEIDKIENFQYKIFSTYEACLEWLND